MPLIREHQSLPFFSLSDRERERESNNSVVLHLLKKEKEKWEGLLVVQRLVCIEVHGLPGRTHCLPNILKLMVKAIGDPCPKKLVYVVIA